MGQEQTVYTSQPWSIPELAVVYHLVNWGYNYTDVNNKAATALPHRSLMSIGYQGITLRKWMTWQLSGQRTGSPISDSLTKKFDKVIKQPVPDSISRYEPAIKSDFVQIRSTKQGMGTAHGVWELKEIAILYHLIMWGGDNQSILRDTKGLFPNRSESGIENQAGEVRRWISDTMGYPIGEPITDTQKVKYNKASKIKAPDSIMHLKPADTTDRFVPIRVHSRKIKGLGAGLATKPHVEEEIKQSEATTQEFNQPETSEADKILEFMNSHPNRVKPELPEPTIIEVIEAAQRMGVKEVEYKGVILRF